MTTLLIISLLLLAHILWKLHLWNWLQPSADCQCMPDPLRLLSFTKASAILHLDSIWSLAALQQHLWLCTLAGASTHLSQAVRICCCMFLHSSSLSFPDQTITWPFSHFTSRWANSVTGALLPCDTISSRSLIFQCLHLAIFITLSEGEPEISIAYNRLTFCSFF